LQEIGSSNYFTGRRQCDFFAAPSISAVYRILENPYQQKITLRILFDMYSKYIQKKSIKGMWNLIEAWKSIEQLNTFHPRQKNCK
jgi:hypothetical protein